MAKIKAKKIIDAINKGIAVNPTTFEVNSVKKVLVDGSYEKLESTITYTGIVYLDEKSDLRIIDSKTEGTSYLSKRYKMILNNENELEVNEANKIEFDIKEGHMKITAAYSIVIEDTLCGYLCDLERS